MPVETTQLKREFAFTKNGEKVTLPDPNPDFSAQEVLDFYSSQYPELTTATLDQPKVSGNTAVYSVKTSVGTKG